MTDSSIAIPPTAKLRLDSDALVSNWHMLDRMSGDAGAGAAVKADAYGLGAITVVQKLEAIGCRDFFVANWQEAAEIANLITSETSLSVLNGVRREDMDFAVTSRAKPVLNSPDQIKRWADTGRPCDIMINSGMNRLGIDMEDIDHADLDALQIDIAMSHLASADEDSEQNAEQLGQYNTALSNIRAKRRSLANSAAICLGADYHFDCTRPGLSLYGGRQRPELQGWIKQVVRPQAQILQIRNLQVGDKLGYNARYTAERAHPVATLAMGYADGYLRRFSNKGHFVHGKQRLPVIGRISMDLIAIDITDAADLTENDWVECEYDLPQASAVSGLSQYELITGLGQRLEREWF